MNLKNLSLQELCPCGGRLLIGGAPAKNGQMIHLVIKCEKCGAWRGGFTYKNKKRSSAHDQGTAAKLSKA